MKSPTSASPPMIGASTFADEKPPVLPISASPYVISGMPVTTKSNPRTSSRPASSGSLRGSPRSAAMKATTPIGALTKKIQRHVVLSRMKPPSAGPRIGASIAGTATTLITRPMRRGPAAAAIIIWPTGRIRPPPTPWMTRNTINSVAELATPQRTDPTVNRNSEVR